MQSDQDDLRSLIKSKRTRDKITLENTIQPTSIKVSNLDPLVSSQDVSLVFSKFGEITNIQLSTDFTRIIFKDSISASEAVVQYNGQLVDGRIISVQVDYGILLKGVSKKMSVFNNKPYRPAYLLLI